MEIYRSARKLRVLIQSHDKAVHQIKLLDSKIQDISQRMAKQDTPEDPMSVTYSLLDQRKSIMEFIHNMYHIYRIVKWQQIQNMVTFLWGGFVPTDINSIITTAMMEYSDSISSDEDGNPSLLEEEMIVNERVI